jgi:hypothetical protein
MTDEIQAALQGLLSDVEPSTPPGPIGRAISEAFNDRPWLTDPGWKGRGRLNRT